jgi:hypothetical protein
MTLLIFKMANAKFKAMREKEGRKKNPLKPNHDSSMHMRLAAGKKNDVMLPTLLLKAAFDRQEVPHSPFKKHGQLLLVGACYALASHFFIF